MLSDHLTINERRDHCDLQTICQPGSKDKRKTRNALRQHLGLTKSDIKGMACCHLCECDSQNGGCTNPKHLYFGTHEENIWDKHFGHFNHPDPNSEGWLRPYCPTCGYYSTSPGNERNNLNRHVQANTCAKPRIGRPVHPDFIKGS
jgi:hypothetical protein